MTFLAWTQLIVLIAGFGIAAGAALVAFVLRPGTSYLRTLAPQARFGMLAFLTFLPALLGAMGLVVAFAPSVLDGLGLVADHCGHHPGHAFHLCFIHGVPPEAPGWFAAVAAAIVGWASWIVLGEAARWARTRRWAKRFEQVSNPDQGLAANVFQSERPLAFGVGFFRPRIFLSTGLKTILSEAQLEAVLAHERAHVRRRDALVKSVARLASALHLPPIRRRLLRELELASEQACDASAVVETGDRLAVAEAILAVRRAGRGAVPPAVVGFGVGDLEARIRGLLEDDWRTPGRVIPGLVLVLPLVAFVHQYAELHHFTETVLARLF